MCFRDTKNKPAEHETDTPRPAAQGRTTDTGPQKTALPSPKRSSYRYVYRDPQFSPDSTSILNFECCRYCSHRFTYIRDDKQRIHIIAGLPGEQPYKAISYVWGRTTKLHMYCIGCQRSFAINMRDGLKFKSIVSLAVAEELLWLDTLSIDQDDKGDIDRQVHMMGKIYADASSIAVLLPQTDESAFYLLSSLVANASFINEHKMEFSHNQDPYSDQRLTQYCQAFYLNLEELEQALPKWTYWSRAWTFQEWAMAADLDIGLEGNDMILRNIKYSILYAATLTAVYKLQQGAFANIELGFSRGEVPRYFDIVKRVFPDELAFLSPDESAEDSEKTNFQTLFPSLGVDSLLGLRTASPPTPLPGTDGSKKAIHELFELRPSQIVQQKLTFLSRLSTMLNAFAMLNREARFEADLVQCWASMCNIQYTYNKNDSYATALQLALAQIRREPNVRIFTWQANTNAQFDPVDLSFLDYAIKHAQRNARNPIFFAGTPVLTGRADTLRHIELSLQQPNTLLELPGRSAITRPVLQIESMSAAQMDHIEKTIEHFRTAIIGEGDGIMFHDLVPMIRNLLENASTEVLRTKALTVVTIRTRNPVDQSPSQCKLWTVIPYDRQNDRIMVARESSNGQLVLLKHKGYYAEIIGYLALTHQWSGTYMAWCSDIDAGGVWIQKMDVPKRSDIVVSGLMDNDIWYASQFALAPDVQRLR